MPAHYTDKSWKQNRFPQLKCADGETTVSRQTYDRWDGDTEGVLKAMKISFVLKFANSLTFDEGIFLPIVAGTIGDMPATDEFKDAIIGLSMTMGHRFKNPAITSLTEATADAAREDCFEELTDIFDDLMVQLSDAIHVPSFDIDFKEERKAKHPLMALRILRRIKSSVYKAVPLDQCITTAQKCAAAGPTWSA